MKHTYLTKNIIIQKKTPRYEEKSTTCNVGFIDHCEGSIQSKDESGETGRKNSDGNH